MTHDRPPSGRVQCASCGNHLGDELAGKFVVQHKDREMDVSPIDAPV